MFQKICGGKCLIFRPMQFLWCWRQICMMNLIILEVMMNFSRGHNGGRRRRVIDNDPSTICIFCTDAQGDLFRAGGSISSGSGE